MTNADLLILYVLMRTDLPDYKSGKSMAQANHAGTKFLAECLTLDRTEHHSELVHVDEWLNEGGGFGTCVVLGVTRRAMFTLLDQAKLGGIRHGFVHDPSYPILDGDIIQHLPVDTCGYIFGRKSRCSPILGNLSLFQD